MNLSSTKLVVGLSGLALALTAAVGVASAEPDVNPIVNTTCSYPQVVAALNAQAPDLAYQVNTSPMVQSTLQRFLASPPASAPADGAAVAEHAVGAAVHLSYVADRQQLQRLYV